MKAQKSWTNLCFINYFVTNFQCEDTILKSGGFQQVWPDPWPFDLLLEGQNHNWKYKVTKDGILVYLTVL